MSETRTLTLQNPRPGIASATIVYHLGVDGKPQVYPHRNVALHVQSSYSPVIKDFYLASILGAKAYYAREFQSRKLIPHWEKPVWKEGQG